MKNQKNLAILGAVTVVAIGAALVALAIGGGNDVGATRGKLFADLEERINDVARIRIRTADETRTLALEEEAWGVEECAGYPADVEKVKEAIWTITELEIEAPKTKRPERYAELGVEDVDAEDSKSTEVVLSNAAGEEIAAVIVGETSYRRGGQSVFARRLGEEQAFQCSGRASFEASVKSWVDASIMKIPASRVTRVIIDHGDEIVEIDRLPGEGDRFAVGNVPEDRTEKYDGVANSVAGTLASLDLDDVRPLGDVSFEGESLVVAAFTLGEGLDVIVRSVEVDETTWISVTARFEAPVGPPALPDPPPDEEGTEPEPADPEEDLLAGSKEAQEINERHGPWAYAIPAYKATNLRKPLEELLAELPEIVEPEDELPPVAPETDEPPAEDGASDGSDAAEDGQAEEGADTGSADDGDGGDENG